MGRDTLVSPSEAGQVEEKERRKKIEQFFLAFQCTCEPSLAAMSAGLPSVAK